MERYLYYATNIRPFPFEDVPLLRQADSMSPPSMAIIQPVLHCLVGFRRLIDSILYLSLLSARFKPLPSLLLHISRITIDLQNPLVLAEIYTRCSASPRISGTYASLIKVPGTVTNLVASIMLILG